MESGLPLLSLLVWVPILGGGALLLLGDQRADSVRWSALLVSLLTFLMSVQAWLQFDLGTYQMQFQELAAWIPAFHIDYHLGVDGISLPLILLTT